VKEILCLSNRLVRAKKFGGGAKELFLREHNRAAEVLQSAEADLDFLTAARAHLEGVQLANGPKLRDAFAERLKFLSAAGHCVSLLISMIGRTVLSATVA